MMGFKQFVAERSIDTLALREKSDLEAQLSTVNGMMGLLEEGPRKAMLNSKRLQLMEALKRQSKPAKAAPRSQS